MSSLQTFEEQVEDASSLQGTVFENMNLTGEIIYSYERSQAGGVGIEVDSIKYICIVDDEGNLIEELTPNNPIWPHAANELEERFFQRELPYDYSDTYEQ